MASNVCGILAGGIDPAQVASRLGSLGWRTRSASINGVIDPHRINDLSTHLARFGWQHSLELSDENDNVVAELHH